MVLVDIKLQCLGGGKMGEALLRGLMASGWADEGQLAVVEALANRREDLAGQYPEMTVTDQALTDVDTLLAVKPTDVAEAVDGLACARLLSIAAGVRTAVLEGMLPAGCRVVRAMPNTPALLGQGAAGVAAGSVAGEEDLSWAVGILESVGKVVTLPEELLDAVTGVSGSGPAYVFLLAEAMMSAAVEVGLSAEDADVLVRQTLLGSAMLLAEGGEPPEVLRQNVTSPGGTTAAALEVLGDRQFGETMTEAIVAAVERSRELGA